MISGIVYVLVIRDWLEAAEFTNKAIMGGGSGVLTTTGLLIIFLILLKIGWKVSTRIRTKPVKSFLNQTTHSKVIIKNSNVPYVHHWMRFHRKILGAFV